MKCATPALDESSAGHVIRAAPAPRPKVPTVSAFDLLVVLGFLLLALQFHYSRTLARSPFPFLGGDVAQYASYAAALDHPELFQNDPLLGDRRNFGFQLTIHVPLARWMAGRTGDYASFFACLYGPHLFLQALGFYVFGRVLFGRRYWAVLLACLMLVPVQMNLGEYWGTSTQALPRQSFQSLLPFILAAAYHWRRRPAAWPIVLAAVGLLIYVHPPSAPGWALAIWLAFWVYLPCSWRRPKRLGYMFLIGMTFLAVCTPFLWNYLGGHAHGPTEDYDQVFHIMEYRYTSGYMDLPAALLEYARLMTRNGLIPCALVGALLLLALRRPDRKCVAFVGLWAAGLAIVGVAIPLTEHAVARALRMLPVEVDLIRTIRFLIPIMLLLCLWPLVEFSKRLDPRAATAFAAIAGLAVGVWAYRHQFHTMLQPPWYWLEAKVGPESLARDPHFQMLEAIRRQVPAGATILPAPEFPRPLSIRYHALRGVAHTWKDGGPLSYSDHRRLLRWYELDQRFSRAVSATTAEAKLSGLWELAGQLGAQYLLIPTPGRLADPARRGQPSPPEPEVIYANGSYTLLRGRPLELANSIPLILPSIAAPSQPSMPPRVRLDLDCPPDRMRSR